MIARCNQTPRILMVLATLALGLVSSCTKSKESSVKVTADYLHVKGTVTKDSLPISGAAIRIVDRSETLAITDTNGNYNFTLADTELTQLAEAEKTRLGDFATGKFEVFYTFEDADGQTFTGNFGGIDFSSLGTVETGTTELAAAAGITGTILVLGPDGEFHPAKGVTVSSGLMSATSDANGTFTVTALPSGKRVFYLTNGTDISLSRHTFSLQPGQTNVLNDPILVYPDNLVAGTLTALPAGTPAELLQAGRPYRRNFKVNASPAAKYIKISDNEQDFQFESQSLARWQAVTDQVNFDFEGNGTHTLYYQFAEAIPDGETQNISRLQSIYVEVNLFSDSGGVFLGDGSGIIRSYRVPVNIDVPAAAVEMRLSERQSDFVTAPGVPGGLPWQEAKPAIEYILSHDDGNNPNQLRELFCQFRAADGTESSLFRYTAVLSVFPEVEDIFRIEDGSGRTEKRLVDINIDLPENAYEMRVYEEIITGGVQVGGVLVQVPTRQLIADTYIRAKDKVQYYFLQAGRKTIFLQFRDRDGIESPVYKQDVLIVPFEPQGEGFQINGGATTAVERDLVIDLFPPEEAVAYRISDDEFDLDAREFSVIRNQLQFQAQSIGLITIYIQYQDIYGEKSFVYSKDIYIDPFFSDPGSFLVNGGATFTDSQLLQFAIDAPSAAVEMSISEAFGVSCESSGGGGGGGGGGFGAISPGFVPVSPFFEGAVDGFGYKTLCVRFRTFTGETSPFLPQVIYVDHFSTSPEFVINGGAAITHSSRIDLEFVTTPEFEADDALITVTGPPGSAQVGPFLQGNNTVVPIDLDPDSRGKWKIEARYQDVDGNLGRVATRVIEYILPAAFLSISGANTATTPVTVSDSRLNISVDLPDEVVVTEISVTLDDEVPGTFQDVTGISGNIFTVVRDIPAGTADDSLHSLYLWYRTNDGVQSAPFKLDFIYDSTP